MNNKRRTNMSQVLSKDGTVIAFEKLVQGPAVIVVGGQLGDRSQQAPLAALLSSHFTVYNYDRRGHGESGFTAPYAVEREIEDLEALINEAGGSALVYGTSGCAVLALEAAAWGLVPKTKKLALWEPRTSSMTVVLLYRRITRSSSPPCCLRVVEATWSS